MASPDQPRRRPQLLRDIAAGLDRHNLTNGFVGFLFSITGPLAIMLAVSTQGGLSEADIGSWIFSGYLFGGVLSIWFSVRYRQPLTLAWTIPGAVLLGPALARFSFPEMIGAYIGTAVVITALGLSGMIGRVMKAIPLPIVMSMVAGVFLPICLKIVSAFGAAPAMATAMVAAFVAVSAAPRLARVFPPVLGALAAGIAAVMIGGGLATGHPIRFGIGEPILYQPQFTWPALVAMVVPLTVTVVGIHNAQAFAILRSAGYAPPENALTLGCGLGSFVFAAFGAVPTCVTGPVNAILNLSGERSLRFVGGIVFGTLIFLFGLFAPVTASVALALPAAFIATLGGLALIAILRDAFRSAFSGAFTLGALVTFLVTISDISIYNVGAAFWGLVAGFVTSWLLEREDFRALAAAADRA